MGGLGRPQQEGLERDGRRLERVWPGAVAAIEGDLGVGLGRIWGPLVDGFGRAWTRLPAASPRCGAGSSTDCRSPARVKRWLGMGGVAPGPAPGQTALPAPSRRRGRRRRIERRRRPCRRSRQHNNPAGRHAPAPPTPSGATGTSRRCAAAAGSGERAPRADRSPAVPRATPAAAPTVPSARPAAGAPRGAGYRRRRRHQRPWPGARCAGCARAIRGCRSTSIKAGRWWDDGRSCLARVASAGYVPWRSVPSARRRRRARPALRQSRIPAARRAVAPGPRPQGEGAEARGLRRRARAHRQGEGAHRCVREAGAGDAHPPVAGRPRRHRHRVPGPLRPRRGRHGGVFQLAFAEAGESIYPAAAKNAAGVVDRAAATAKSAIGGRLLQNFTLDKVAGWVADSAGGVLKDAFTSIGPIGEGIVSGFGKAAAWAGDLNQALATVTTIVRNPAALVSRVLGLTDIGNLSGISALVQTPLSVRTAIESFTRDGGLAVSWQSFLPLSRFGTSIAALTDDGTYYPATETTSRARVGGHRRQLLRWRWWNVDADHRGRRQERATPPRSRRSCAALRPSRWRAPRYVRTSPPPRKRRRRPTPSRRRSIASSQPPATRTARRCKHSASPRSKRSPRACRSCRAPSSSARKPPLRRRRARRRSMPSVAGSATPRRHLAGHRHRADRLWRCHQ